ncbi:Rap1a/Tai family immunity protein [Erwinia sp. E_sp_B01_9]|uniref:Rap1a/Tai family immunity protein n=1 Tax=unclassified Erwinia TaxID=2622719 RepID=UPI003D9B7A8B
MKRLLIALALIGSSFSASATDGNELYKWRLSYQDKSGSNFEAGMYIGFIGGVTGIFTDEIFCIPEGTLNRQVYDIVLLYLQNNPKDRTKSGSSLVLTALHNAYPCQKNK